MSDSNGSSDDYATENPYQGGGGSDPAAGNEPAPSAGGDAGAGWAVTCTCGDKSITVYCPTEASAKSALCDCSDPRNPSIVCGPIY
jgi:hypothetical protein